MNIIYKNLIGILWLAFLIYWSISARGVKRDAYRERGWWLSLIILWLAATIVGSIWPVLSVPQFPQTGALRIVAVIMTLLGMGFAIWARMHLGKNWSSQPAVKEGHELITSGPYRFVRHPIYTGITFAFLAVPLLDGVVWDFFVLAIIIVFVRRIRTEERLMTEQFPDQYPAYKKRTKALIPFVW